MSMDEWRIVAVIDLDSGDVLQASDDVGCAILCAACSARELANAIRRTLPRPNFADMLREALR